MTEGYTDMAGVSHNWVWRADHIKCSSLAVLLSVGGVPRLTRQQHGSRSFFQWGLVEDTFTIDTQELKQEDFEFQASLTYKAKFQNAPSQATSS